MFPALRVFGCGAHPVVPAAASDKQVAKQQEEVCLLFQEAHCGCIVTAPSLTATHDMCSCLLASQPASQPHTYVGW